MIRQFKQAIPLDFNILKCIRIIRVNAGLGEQ